LTLCADWLAVDTRAGVILRPSAGWSPEHVNITTALDLYGPSL